LQNLWCGGKINNRKFFKKNFKGQKSLTDFLGRAINEKFKIKINFNLSH